jgi:acetylornithine/N-succinyldiaminopimelate aminotransferase
MKNCDTMQIEDSYSAPFFNKTKISIERGEGVYVWDEDGKRYLDFTGGWGVTSIGHASPVIARALAEQSGKIIHNPDSGLTYSPCRAKLLSRLKGLLPHGLTRIFFTNSGAEAVDAALKLARKASGKKNVLSAMQSFHGRTISGVSATGQHAHRDKYQPLVPNHLYVPFDDVPSLEAACRGNDLAAFIVEPVQGEGGVRIPAPDYLERVSDVCARHNVYLILDEVQTGFFRTGPPFVSSGRRLKVDFLAMAKGIAGGFPFGAFAMSEEVSAKLAKGDHGGTYCGNPLGCAVASAVIEHLTGNDIGSKVAAVGGFITERLRSLRSRYPGIITDVRGAGLLIGMDLDDPDRASSVKKQCLDMGLLVNLTQGTVIRIFPALTITRKEAEEGLAMLEAVISKSK